MQAVGLEKWHTSVSRLKCSQLHGPHVVLVGEAAHSVTSHDGQGCNAAMESVEVLGQVLDKVLHACCMHADIPALGCAGASWAGCKSGQFMDEKRASGALTARGSHELSYGAASSGSMDGFASWTL